MRLFAVIIVMPLISLGFILHSEPIGTLAQLERYSPVAALILLLIYFFRVLLMHFNSTQAQLLQLELKMSALGFIQEYVSFKKENDSPDLSKFEALVFGGIVADLDKVPSTFDGLDQLAATINALRGGKDKG